jgi:hypothetical protein
LVVNKNLDKIESISENLIELIQAFDKSICHLNTDDRFKVRAKSIYYQTLSILMAEILNFKQYTSISNIQLQELKRKINSLLRLADETGVGETNQQIFNCLQSNIIFQF